MVWRRIISDGRESNGQEFWRNIQHNIFSHSILLKTSSCSCKNIPVATTMLATIHDRPMMDPRQPSSEFLHASKYLWCCFGMIRVGNRSVVEILKKTLFRNFQAAQHSTRVAIKVSQFGNMKLYRWETSPAGSHSLLSSILHVDECYDCAKYERGSSVGTDMDAWTATLRCLHSLYSHPSGLLNLPVCWRKSQFCNWPYLHPEVQGLL